MEHSCRTSRLLHQEHRAGLDLLGRIERALARPRRDPDLTTLVASLSAFLAKDVDRHFAFEERELFARMAAAGEGDIAELLTEEHEAIRAVAAELVPLFRDVPAGTLDDAGWDALRRLTFELIERQVAHIQKEEMGLLPLLDDLLDDDADRALSFAYAAS